MRYLFTKAGHNENGQGLVEFALVLGLLIILILSALQLFDLERQRAEIDKVARQAAVEASAYGGDTAEVRAYIATELERIGRDPSTVTVEIAEHVMQDGRFVKNTPVNNQCPYGGHIGVQVQAPWDFFIPGVGLFTEDIEGSGTFNITHVSRCYWGEID